MRDNNHIFSEGKEREFQYCNHHDFYFRRAKNYAIGIGVSALTAAGIYCGCFENGVLPLDNPKHVIEGAGFILGLSGSAFCSFFSIANFVTARLWKKESDRCIEDIFSESMEEFPEEAKIIK